MFNLNTYITMNKKLIADSKLSLAQNESKLFGIVDDMDCVIVPFEYNVGQTLYFGGKEICFLHKNSENCLVFDAEKIISFTGCFSQMHECCAICAPFLQAYDEERVGVLRIEGNEVITVIPPVYDFINGYAWPEISPTNPNKYMPAQIFEAYTADTLKKECDIFSASGEKLFQKAKIIEVANNLCALQTTKNNSVFVYSFSKSKVVLQGLYCTAIYSAPDGSLRLLSSQNSFFRVKPDGEVIVDKSYLD